jgi:hypothetical protein
MAQALIRNFTFEQVKQKVGNSNLVTVEMVGTLPLVKTVEPAGHPTDPAAAALVQQIADEDAVLTREKIDKKP